MAATLLIDNGTVCTLGSDPQVIEGGGVLIEGDTIAAVGPAASLRSKASEVIDAGGRLVMPGLICAHHHLYSTFACGIAAEPASNFVEVLERLWWKLDRALDLDDVYYSAVFPLARCIRAGTTTLLDHHASPTAIEGSLGRIGDAVEEAGLRASLCYEVTDRNGAEGAQAGIRENAAWLERCGSSPRLHGLVGVHAAMTVGQATLEECVKLADRFDTGLHIHVAEDQADQDHSVKEYGKRVIERLHAAGGLGAKTLAVHCVHVDDAEIELLRSTDTTVVHNPQSNMNNAVGCAAVPALLERGIRVCLGTDGMTSDMLEEARASLFVRHHVAKSPSVGFGETVRMLFANNSALASAAFGRTLGVLAPGAAADVIVTDHLPFTPVTPDNVFGHVLFGVAAAGIRTTICDGRVLMRDRELETLDVQRAAAAARERTGRTWERFAAL
ncbi:MAG: putative aminohydrolase SsnA [Deltaproteobacteria bacterium]|jgi:putative selenium metabolism protein SsnA|nr:putative aminohydrolase SsnA [Deltaproteobacteria bacterium]MBW2532906.1 putative aminohydrolase SsnA [Deltaproteobacteria bacterium]